MHDPFEPTKAELAATRLTAAERKDALANRGDPQWTDDFVLELAREDKARDRKMAAADWRTKQMTDLSARVRKIECYLAAKGGLTRALSKVIPDMIEMRLNQKAGKAK